VAGRLWWQPSFWRPGLLLLIGPPAAAGALHHLLERAGTGRMVLSQAVNWIASGWNRPRNMVWGASSLAALKPSAITASGATLAALRAALLQLLREAKGRGVLV